MPQDDLLMEDLTVFQNLYFAAKLFSIIILKRKSIGSSLKHLMILAWLKSRICVGSHLQKTIAVVNEKRLNIGLNCFIEPSVLFVDETELQASSSRDSGNIIDLLKELSLKGKLIFAVIHQPSIQTYLKCLSKLVILDTGGYQIYYGNPVDAVTYFKKCIHMVKQWAGRVPRAAMWTQTDFNNIIETKVINEYGNFTNERKFIIWPVEQKFRDNKIPAVTTASEQPEKFAAHSGLVETKHTCWTSWWFADAATSSISSSTWWEAPVLAFILAFFSSLLQSRWPIFGGLCVQQKPEHASILLHECNCCSVHGLTVSAEEIIRDRKILNARSSWISVEAVTWCQNFDSVLLSAFKTATFVW